MTKFPESLAKFPGSLAKFPEPCDEILDKMLELPVFQILVILGPMLGSVCALWVFVLLEKASFSGARQMTPPSSETGSVFAPVFGGNELKAAADPTWKGVPK